MRSTMIMCSISSVFWKPNFFYLRFVEFGTKSNARLVICCSETALAVWDVITFSLLWAIPFQAESLAVDPIRGIAVAFSTKRHGNISISFTWQQPVLRTNGYHGNILLFSAYFFSPSNPEPLAVHHNVSKSKVLSSMFIPTDYGKSAAMKSFVVFMNLSHVSLPSYTNQRNIGKPWSQC